MDNAAYWATVHGVAKSWTQRSNLVHVHTCTYTCTFTCVYAHTHTHTHTHTQLYTVQLSLKIASILKPEGKNVCVGGKKQFE